jgi:hypothetical protein
MSYSVYSREKGIGCARVALCLFRFANFLVTEGSFEYKMINSAVSKFRACVFV